MDEIILILRTLIEILNTKFIKNTYFSNTNFETIKSYLNFLNDFEQNIDIAKKVYPDICYYLPEFKKLFVQIYENKLTVEEAEYFIRREK